MFRIESFLWINDLEGVKEFLDRDLKNEKIVV